MSSIRVGSTGIIVHILTNHGVTVLNYFGGSRSHGTRGRRPRGSAMPMRESGCVCVVHCREMNGIIIRNCCFDRDGGADDFFCFLVTVAPR